jgi:hypothetical protein
VTLDSASPLEIRYMFGLAPAPAAFGAVAGITPAPGGLRLADAAGRTSFAACDPAFVSG